MNTSEEKLRIHFAYWVSILLLFIIAIATDKWTSQPNFTEYLSNAATMTSLVLGVVAILYSFIANNGLSKSLGNISRVSDEVKESKDAISKYLELTRETGETAKANAELVQKASVDVSSTLGNLNQTLFAIGSQTETLHKAVAGLPTRLDQLETNVLDATKALGPKAPSPSVNTSKANIDPAIAKRFLSLSSLSCNLLTIACVLAHQKKRPLSLAEFCATLELKLENYMSGFIACMDALQLIDIEEVTNKERTYTITTVHATLSNESREYYLSFLDRVYKDKPEIHTRWTDRLARLEASFA